MLFSQNRYINSEYIETVKETLNIKLDIDNDIQSFDYETEKISYSISPNLYARTNLSFNYRFINFKIGYSPRFLSPDDSDKKGKTKILKFQTDIFIKNWVQTLEFSKIRGYYVSDIINHETNKISSDIILLPDLNTVNLFGRTLYKFNKNLSLEALYRQTQIQRKSAGSLLAGLSYSYLDIRDQTSIQDLNNFESVLSAGYIYTFVMSKRWFAFINLLPGIGMEFSKVTTKIDEQRDISRNNDFIFNFFGQLGVGYNSKNFYSGIDIRGIYTGRNNSSIIKFDTTRDILRIYVGYRFKAPRFIRKGVDWIEDKNPF